MRTFHCVILAYALLIAGCGYKGMPFWRDTPQQPAQESKAQEGEK